MVGITDVAKKIVRRPAMMVGDEFHLGTFEKLTRYGRLPCKFILSLLLCLFVLVWVAMGAADSNSFTALSTEMIGDVFGVDWDLPSMTERKLYSSDDVIDTVIDAYDGFTELTESESGLWFDPNLPLMSITLLKNTSSYKELLSNPRVDLSTITQSDIPLNDSYPAGPFTPPHNSQLIEKTKQIKVKYKIRSMRLQPSDAFKLKTCIQWSVEQVFDFPHNGLVTFYLNIGYSNCGSDFEEPMSTAGTQIEIVILILALWSFILRSKAILRTRQMRSLLTSALSEHSSNVTLRSRLEPLLGSHDGIIDTRSMESDSGDSESVAMFYHHALNELTSVIDRNKRGYSWLTTGVLADAVLLISLSLKMHIVHTSNTIQSGELMVFRILFGLGCIAEWCVLVSPLGDQPWFYLLMITIQKGTPKASRFILSCLPIYLGYAMLGCHVFGSYCSRFSSLDASSVTLFSVSNGDVVHDVFDDIFPSSGRFYQVFSRIYLYSFILLFIYAVLNIFLAIMEDTYFQVKRALVLDLQVGLRK